MLLHAYADSWRSFERVLEALPPSIHALAPTQRGHGSAPKPASGYGPADFAADLVAFLDDVGLEAAILVASSSAGFTAREFAADHPERTRGIVFVGSPNVLAGRPAVDEMRARIAELADPVAAEFVREFVAETVSAAAPADFLDAMVRESLQVPAHVWRLALDGLLDARPPKARLAGPALLIWGEADAFLDRDDQEALAASFGDAELRAYPGAGHVVHWEQPERVAADVAAFAAALG